MDSFFANKPPTADPQDVFTNSQSSIDIFLSGFDPEASPLTFVVTSLPTLGTLSDSMGHVILVGELLYTLPSVTMTYVPGTPSLNLEDSFDFKVIDLEDAESAPAEVRINPTGPPDTTPDDPLLEVVANPQLCELVEVSPEVFMDVCDLETIEGGATITILLTAAAPCEVVLTDEDMDVDTPPTDFEPCDTLGNDVPLEFSVSSTMTSGMLTNLVQGSGHLQEPSVGPEVPQRTATVDYTPPVGGFTGVDSFTFEVEGDVDDSGGIDGSAEPNPEVDAATVQISVQTFTPVPDVEARDQVVSTQVDTPVDISLSGGPAGCADLPNDPDCRLSEVLLSSSVEESDGRPAVPVEPTSLTVVDGETYTIDFVGDAYTLDGTAMPTLVGETRIATDLTDSGLLVTNCPANPCISLIGDKDGFGIGVTEDSSFDFCQLPGPFSCNANGAGDGDGTDLWILGTRSFTHTFPFDSATFATLELFHGGVLTCNAGAPSGEVRLDGILVGTLTPGTPANTARVDVFDLTPALAQINGSDTVTVTLDACDGWALDYAELTTSDEDVEVLPVGFTVLSLPEEVTDDSTDPPTLNGVVTGTLSYVDPITGTTIVITADDITLPDPDGLLLPSERVTYTPPPPLGEAEAFEGLVAFHFSLSDGLSSDDGFIFIDVGGEVPVEIDPCVAVGRSLGCEAGELAGAAGSGGEGASGESPRIRTLPFEQIDALIGPTLTVVVEGPGTVTSNPKRWVGDRLLGLVCTTDSVCGVKFPLGALVGLLARPDDDAEFAGWQGQCQGGDITAVPINGDTVCRAVFEGADKLKVSTGYRTVPTRE